MSALNFNARTVAPAIPGEAIPADWYKGVVVESKMVENSQRNGHYLQLQFQIIEGPYAGRKQTDRLNLDNQNHTAVEIAYQTLSAICHATGVLDVADSEQLHNIPLEFKVIVRPAGPGADGKNYEASNEIRGYRKIGGVGVPSAPPAFAVPPAPPAAPAWTPPVAPPAPPAAPPQAATQTPWVPPAPAAAPAWTPPAQASVAPPWATPK
jgi:hypothetical protein